MGRAVVGLAIVTLMAIALAACVKGGNSAPPLNVTVVATEFKFEPAVIAAAAGQTIHLALQNAGNVEHTWVLEAANVRIVAPPGKTESKTFAAPTVAGSYPIFCDVPGHKDAGMVGLLVVQ